MQNQDTSRGLVMDTGGPRHRKADPVTSQLAAEGSDLEGSQAAVFIALAGVGERGATDEEIKELVVGLGRWSDARLRSARAELVAAGVVVDSGSLRTTSYGRDAKVWILERYEEDEAAA
ncbi:hypothetical protein [Humibacter sp.]|uniref:hypothetical protein n=1 Tax=Humibacter sp. TaxID=1940291 RepID=UPI003F8190FE